jgi:hypothetical protein
LSSGKHSKIWNYLNINKMKTLSNLVIALIIINGHSLFLSAQTPQAIPYQAVARDINGNLIAGQNISLRFSIVDQYIIPTVYYQETQTATSNVLGLFTANVGHGTPVTGVFAEIAWGGGLAKYLKVEMDATGGSNYVDMGSSPLLSVPYALYSEKSANGMPSGSGFGSTMYWNGAGWDNNTNLFNGGQNIGIGTANPSTTLEVAGTTTTTNIAVTGGASAGYLLQSDADGNATWINPATIIGPEIDPQVGSSANNKVPKWNGASLVDGSIYDDGKVGIGTNAPEFKLSLEDDGGIIAKGAFNSGVSLTTSGAGTRMMWYPRRGAFRAGIVNGNLWDDANIGFGSFAGGQDNRALGSYSTAFGIGCDASGDYSFAQGNNNEASAYQAVAMGNACHAYGIRSIAVGDQASANHQSRAFGNLVYATGTYSTALGNYISTNGKEGAFGIGDFSASTVLNSPVENSFSSRFAGGYSFYTDTLVTTAKALFLNNGKAGIGTSTPEFKLTLDNDGGIIARGILGSGASLTTAGSGTRMIWYPKKAAFRAGYTSGAGWDDVNIGNNSFAAGYNSKASGNYSTAMGYSTTASYYNTTALGSNTVASAEASTAMGYGSEASGNYSTAMGYGTTASGEISTAMGYMTRASGDNSTAMGNYVSTNNSEGAFIIGDNSTTTVMTSLNNNGFKARFAGGYKLFSDAATTVGVYLSPGASSWTVVSDRNKKENFQAINNEDVLLKVGALRLTNWNYKAQAKDVRHIGCMAQDFYAAFRLDGESDTTINSLDIDGINMAAIQALKVRTDELKKAAGQIEALTALLAKLEQRVDALAKKEGSVSAMNEIK